MRFEEQVRRRLIELTARDGFVEVEQLIGWSTNNLLANAPPAWAWPERLVVEAVLKTAFEYFVFAALEVVAMLSRSVDEADDGATAEPEARADLPDAQTGRPAPGQLVPLRALARRSRDANQSRRLLSLASARARRRRSRPGSASSSRPVRWWAIVRRRLSRRSLRRPSRGC